MKQTPEQLFEQLSKKFAPKIDNIEVLDSKILNDSDNIETISEEGVLKFI